MAQTGLFEVGRAGLLCLGGSDVDLFRYCQRVVDLNPQVAHRTFDFGVAERPRVIMRILLSY